MLVCFADRGANHGVMEQPQRNAKDAHVCGTRFLESLGFNPTRQKGDHKFFRHLNGRTATIPDHRGEDLGSGIPAKTSRDAGTGIEEFRAWITRQG